MNRKNTAVFIMVVILMVAAGAGFVQAESEGLVFQARNAFYAGNYAESQKLWNEVQEVGGHEWEANFFLGMTHLRKRDLGEAVEHMNTAYTLRPDHYHTLTNYARILYRSGQYESAHSILDQVPEEKREYNEQYYNLRGLLAMAEGNLSQAIELLATAVEISPENHYVRNNLGLALIRAGDFERAKEHLEKAAAQDPSEAYVYNNLGISYENLNMLEEAKVSYEKALELNPEHQYAEINLDRVLSKLKK